MNSLSSNSGLPKFKRCKIQLIPDFKDGFGISLLKSLMPKFTIYSVHPESPAYAANLRKNDVIIEINGINIEKFKFSELRGILFESKNKGCIEIIAIDQEGYCYYKRQDTNLSNSLTSVNTEFFSTYNGLRTGQSLLNNMKWSDDNICRNMHLNNELSLWDLYETIGLKLKRECNKKNFGFTLYPEMNVANSEIDYYPKVKCVDVGSVADLAGLKTNDHIVEVNNKSTFQQEICEIRPWIIFSGKEIEVIVKRKISQKTHSSPFKDKSKKTEPVLKYSKYNDSKLSIGQNGIENSIFQ